MEENYVLAKQIIEEKFDKSNPYYYMFFSALFGFFMKYPDNIELVTNAFKDTFILIEDRPILEIQKAYDMCLIKDEELAEQDSSVCSYHGVSDSGFGYYIEDGKINAIMTKPTVVCSSYDYSKTLLLNVFIHEMNHIIKGCVNSCGSKAEDNLSTCYNRSGISYATFTYDSNTDLLTETEYYSTLDEVINVYQTTEIMNYILMLDGVVLDKDFQKYIDSLDKDEMKKNNGYDKCCDVFKRIWKNDLLREILEEHLIDGDLEEISIDFDNAVGMECFDQMADLLDSLDYLFCANNNRKNYEKCYRELNHLISSITMSAYKLSK